MIKNITEKNKERIHIITSGYCNNNCIFCCDRNPNITTIGRNFCFYGSPDLTLKGFVKESKRIKGINSLLFTGGEPTLNRKLVDCIRLSRKLGYESIGLQTNGRLLCYQDFCVELLEAGITEINISIHGSNKRIHESLTRTPKGFEQTHQGLCNAISLKGKYSFKVNTNSTITKLNYKDIYKLLKMLLSFNKIDCIVLNVLMYTGNAKRFFNQSLISYTDIATRVKKAIDKLQKNNGCEALPIQLSPMPFCVMRGYEKYVGMQEVPLRIKNRKTEELSRGSTQIKNDRCTLCKYYHICSGIDSVYAEKIGWSEFTPLR